MYIQFVFNIIMIINVIKAYYNKKINIDFIIFNINFNS